MILRAPPPHAQNPNPYRKYDMTHVLSFQVVPSIPPALGEIEEIAHNVAFDWNHRARALFRRLDKTEWEECHQNPVKMLRSVSQERLNEAAGDPRFLSEMKGVRQELRAYCEKPTWYQNLPEGEKDAALRIAYFSMEFGLTESLPNYSGGLGILAGDHMKSASDLGLPLIGVGLLYSQGYFRQHIGPDGWQQEHYPDNEFHHMPIHLECDESGAPTTVEIDYPDGLLTAQIWRVQVGRNSIYLLDANIPENAPSLREITLALYGGDMETRIRQEILLGIGGVRLLHKLNLPPVVCHMNEGHSAFLAIERIRFSMRKFGIDAGTARELTSAGNIFTTHTPVPAGIDIFPPAMMEKYFRSYAESLSMGWDEFMGLGRVHPKQESEPFNMAILALRLSSAANGVSKLHGEVSRKMWQSMWPEVPSWDIPIDSITNGVHFPTWVSTEMKGVFARHLGGGWMDETDNPEIWEGAASIPAEDIWRVKEKNRERLIEFCRKHASRRPPGSVSRSNATMLPNPQALTIGFARRFATYKRAILLLKKPERLVALLTNKEKPVQIIFAGKAHPRDMEGKNFIREIIHFARRENVRDKLVFIEDYDIHVARQLVQGVDLWLNNPRRPQEASGTSGMKAAANGALNLSILDGWWAEGYADHLGWAIGSVEAEGDLDYQDEIECESLFNILEQTVVPLFYERDEAGVPRRWMEMVKRSLESLCPYFNTTRMVREYAEKFYMPLGAHHARLMADERTPAKALSEWKERTRGAWTGIRIQITHISTPQNSVVPLGSKIRVEAEVSLGRLSPEEVRLEIYESAMKEEKQLTNGVASPMRLAENLGNGAYRFHGEVECRKTGAHGLSVRAVPHHPYLIHPFSPHLCSWD